MVLAFGIDKLNPGNPDISVGARSVFLDRRRSERSANGRYLLNCFICIHCPHNMPLDTIALFGGNVAKLAPLSIASFRREITPAGKTSHLPALGEISATIPDISSPFRAGAAG
ncbi:hypothetical protein M1D80_20485 [Phyllobacteriaceae bacterium JZ32]